MFKMLGSSDKLIKVFFIPELMFPTSHLDYLVFFVLFPYLDLAVFDFDISEGKCGTLTMDSS